MRWSIPLTDVTTGPEEIEAAARVIRGRWLTQAEEVERFEAAFAELVGARHAAAVANGTAALHLAYEAAGLGDGDEFIVPALTFVATMSAGLYLGARPVLADCVSPDDLTISVEDIARKITDRTRLIVTMPYGGFCPDMEAILEIADSRGIPVVEDACHAPLACLGGRQMGTYGLAGTFSLFGNKNLTTGEGGVVVSDDAEVIQRVRLLRSHGLTSMTWDRHRNISTDYDVLEMGYNYRMDEIRAAIGTEQIRKLPEATEKRRYAAVALREAIESIRIPDLMVPFAHPRGEPVHHVFAILLPPCSDRVAFRTRMHERGIQTSIHYPLLQRLTLGRKVFADAPPDTPVADSLADRLVSLPMGPHLTDESVMTIADAVARCV